MIALKFDSTLSISIVLALVALIAPTITARINNRHAYRMKELEIKQQRYEQESSHIKQLFEQFLADYGIFIAANHIKYRAEAQKSFCKCLPYIPNDHTDSFGEFYKLLSGQSVSIHDIDLYMRDKLINEIRDILKRM